MRRLGYRASTRLRPRKAKSCEHEDHRRGPKGDRLALPVPPEPEDIHRACPTHDRHPPLEVRSRRGSKASEKGTRQAPFRAAPKQAPAARAPMYLGSAWIWLQVCHARRTKKPRRRRPGLVVCSSNRVFENHRDDRGDACGQGNLGGQHNVAYEVAPEHLKARQPCSHAGRPRPRRSVGGISARPVTLRKGSAPPSRARQVPCRRPKKKPRWFTGGAVC
jgi:hypothetical protein